MDGECNKSGSGRVANDKRERFCRDKGNTMSVANRCGLIVERILKFASCWALVDKGATSCGFIDTSTSCTSKLDVAVNKVKLTTDLSFILFGQNKRSKTPMLCFAPFLYQYHLPSAERLN